MTNNTTKCPKCGGNATRTYEPPYQEYAGASVQGGYYYVECSCGHEGHEKADLSDYDYMENTRGW
jgi:hypothetical protein